MKRFTWVVAAGVVVLFTSFNSTVQTAPTFAPQDGPRASAGKPTAPPTFAKDVAPIVFNKCATCHRPGEVAPMSLLSYEDVRPWAKAIKTKVSNREMPPWGADPKESLPMRNDNSLTQAQIDTIVAWVDAGAPKGNVADMPPAPKYTTGWTNGTEPDVVLEMPVEFEIPAEGELGVQMFYSKVPWNEDRFAEIVELKPSNRAVLHHAGIFFVDIPEGSKIVDGRIVGADGRIIGDRGSRGLPSTDSGLAGSSKLLSWVPGRGLDHHRPDIGKRIPGGKYINWQLHYNVTGRVEHDRTKLGIWFNKVPVTHEVLIRQAGDPLATTAKGMSIYRAEGKEVEYKAIEGSTDRRRTGTPNIPPYVENWHLTGITPVTEDITLYAMSPHMHLRGKSLKWVVTYPDGHEQVILNVPKFDFNWQFNYELAEPLHIPAGSKISGIGVYDNSVRNKWNPGPQLEVYWSEQSWDEMYQPFTEYSVDSQDITILKPVTQQKQ